MILRMQSLICINDLSLINIAIALYATCTMGGRAHFLFPGLVGYAMWYLYRWLCQIIYERTCCLRIIRDLMKDGQNITFRHPSCWKWSSSANKVHEHGSPRTG